MRRLALALVALGRAALAQPGAMVEVPAGPFTMGRDDGPADERPAHRVTLPAFLIDRLPVTHAEFAAFLDAQGREGERDGRRYRRFDHDDADARIHQVDGRWRADAGFERHPVNEVTWAGARDYCAWAGKRLPSEAEWEKAARGTDARIFPWGDEFNIRAANTPVRWARLGREGDTTPVGAFKAGTSPYGLYDMSGNVWEWTASWYLPHPGNTTKSENFGEIYKVLKGGSWWDCSFYKCGISAPTFNRSFFNARVKNASFGFRCAKDAEAAR